MFVQVIQGKVRDKAEVRAQLDRWVTELAPHSVGWLGTTAGVADDGTFVALARFESEAAADKNSSLPEQGAWWAETASVFDGEPTFRNSTWAEVDLPGDPSSAGFVQVMQGRAADLDRLHTLLMEDPEDVSAARPDILGRLACGHADDRWTMAIWFTSEADAREGERKEMPPEVAERMEEIMKAAPEQPTFIDLKEPWMDGPG
jgi:hypothetical protein